MLKLQPVTAGDFTFEVTDCTFNNLAFTEEDSTAVSASLLQVAMRCGVTSDKVKNVIIWGNHSSTQYPDVHHAKVDVHGSELDAYEAVKDDAWLKGDFISVSARNTRRRFIFKSRSSRQSSSSLSSSCRRCSSAALPSSRPGSCPAPCLPPRPSVTT